MPKDPDKARRKALTARVSKVLEKEDLIDVGYVALTILTFVLMTSAEPYRSAMRDAVKAHIRKTRLLETDDNQPTRQ